ncbi:DNA alkylation repair protein [candidate division WWE3 bacterium]|nr:DNA alkylation repair protein [candidate division WWE3 bacterium]
MNDFIPRLKKELLDLSDSEAEKNGKKFFKEEVQLYGIKSSILKKVSTQYFNEIKQLQKKHIFDICEQLWKSEMLEEQIIACNWSYHVNTSYSKDDIEVFEKWLNTYVSNWATCDTFCNHSVGTVVEMYPDLIERVIKWTQSPNRWMKRGAAVSLIIPVRKGLFIDEVFKISDLLITDKDDLVQKGYGWMLKAASESSISTVYQYMIEHKSIMPRTALRYGTEKMPEDMRKRVLAK